MKGEVKLMRGILPVCAMVLALGLSVRAGEIQFPAPPATVTTENPSGVTPRPEADGNGRAQAFHGGATDSSPATGACPVVEIIWGLLLSTLLG